MSKGAVYAFVPETRTFFVQAAAFSCLWDNMEIPHSPLDKQACLDYFIHLTRGSIVSCFIGNRLEQG